MDAPFRIAVTGGREFDDFELMDLALRAIKEYLGTNVALAHGDQRGLDHMAEGWALNNDWWVAPFPANWQKYGKRAGPIRNQQILDEFNPDLVVSFPGGGGTLDMLKRAVTAHKATWSVNRL